MVNHDLLHRELADFASALTQDFDLTEALQQLTVAAVAALDIDGSGVTLRLPAGGTQFITATDPVTLHVEHRQDELQEGACVDAISTSQVVAAADLAGDSRWPQYRPVLLDAGFNAVAGVPIRFHGENIGAINLYANSSRVWTTEEFTAGRLVADLAAGYLINSHLLRDSVTLAEQLQSALDSRVVIEQAKGVLAGRHGVAPDAAFEVMRTHARSARRKIHDVAQDIVTGAVDVVGDATHDQSSTT